MARSKELARIFKALSDPNRLAILQRLRRGGRCCPPGEGSSVSEIADRLDLAMSTVSHHLKELKNAGLICCVKRGQWVYCSPDEKALRRIAEFLES